MIDTPEEIQIQFDKLLSQNSVPEKYRPYYKKWLRFYLDFCRKYDLPQQDKSSKPLFLKKLSEKQQPEAYKRQASHAISIYYQVAIDMKNDSDSPRIEDPDSKSPAGAPKWDNAKKKLENEINVRHYSRNTLKTYSVWVSKFQSHTGNKPPTSLTDDDYKDFPTHLAVNENVAASTQNQAFNAFLFFYRHVLKKEPGDIKSVRAKRKPYIPAVLTRKEVDRIIHRPPYPNTLIVSLLYGCGLRHRQRGQKPP